MNRDSTGLIRNGTRIWLILLALTLITYTIGETGLSGPGLSLLVLGFALLKGQLLGDYFMGLGPLRGPWRWVILIWLLIPGGLIATAFWLAG